MAIEIGEREREGVTILSLKGRITTGESSSFRDRIAELVASGRTKLVLDLAEIDYIDSTGLGGLVICFTQAQRAGGSLKLLKVNRRNVELLALTRLHTVFEVYVEEQDAVNSFFPEREIKKFDVLEFVRQKQAPSTPSNPGGDAVS